MSFTLWEMIAHFIFSTPQSTKKYTQLKKQKKKKLKLASDSTHSTSSTMMNKIPLEVLLQIASHLDTQSCFACRNVCHYWAEAFIPSCLHTVDHLRSPWKQVLKSASPTDTPEEQETRTLRARSLLKRYGSYIRDITIRDDGLLDAAIKARLSRLDSLTICGIVNKYIYSQEYAFMVADQQAINSETTATTMTTTTTTSAEASLESWSELPSMTLFDTGVPKQCLISRTQGCWQLIMNNPGLRRLEFKNQASYTIFPFQSFPPSSMILSTASRDFLDKVLSRLPYLNHLAIEQPAADFVFANLGSRYRNITSFVYPNTDDFGNGILSKTVSSTTLRRLKLQRRIDAENLVELGRIFPELRELFLSAVQVSHHFQHSSDDNNNSVGGQSKEPPLFSKLEYLFVSTIFDIASLSRTGIRLPAVKKIEPTIKFRTLAYIWIILRAYPTLEYLDAMETVSSNQRFGDTLDPASLKPTSSLRLRTLILSHGTAFGTGVGRMLEVMPLLSHLELGLIPPSALEVVTMNCRNLEHLRFNLEQGKGHKELNNLFKACSKLKVCRGKGHEILGEDFIKNHNWACFGLQELDLKIVRVPRMSEAQEPIWEAMQQDRRWKGNTDEERATVKQRDSSYLFQRSIYRNLGKHVHLRHLNLGGHDSTQSGAMTTSADHTAADCLELTLESGLSELARIPSLETLGVGGLRHRMGTRDLQWMCEHWPLKKVNGLEFLRANPDNPLEVEDILDRVKISMMVSEMTNKSWASSRTRSKQT
jgi:hypothetical protein